MGDPRPDRCLVVFNSCGVVNVRSSRPTDCELREEVPTTSFHPGPRTGTWVGIVANASAGLGWGRRKVRRFVRALDRSGFDARLAWDLSERETVLEASRSDTDCRCLVAVGGDGTVANLINAVPSVPMTVLPSGTENLFAQQFRIPSRPEAVVRIVQENRALPLDLGLAEGLRFSLMAGFGFDADVVTRHHEARVRSDGGMGRTHRAAYVVPVLRSSWSYRFPPLNVDVSGPEGMETLSGSTVFVFNLPRYALGLPFAPTASGTDGLLDVVVFRDPGPWRALAYLFHVACRRHLRMPGVFHRRVQRAIVSTSEAVPVQLDGEPAGWAGPDHSWALEVLPLAVSVLVPGSYHDDVLRPA